MININQLKDKGSPAESISDDDKIIIFNSANGRAITVAFSVLKAAISGTPDTEQSILAAQIFS